MSIHKEFGSTTVGARSPHLLSTNSPTGALSMLCPVWRKTSWPKSSLQQYLNSRMRSSLTDLIVAETVYIFESFYETPKSQVAQALRSASAMHSTFNSDAP